MPEGCLTDLGVAAGDDDGVAGFIDLIRLQEIYLLLPTLGKPGEQAEPRRGRDLSALCRLDFSTVTKNKMVLHVHQFSISGLYMLLQDEPALIQHEKWTNGPQIEPYAGARPLRVAAGPFLVPHVRLTGPGAKTRDFLANHISDERLWPTLRDQPFHKPIVVTMERIGE